MVIRIPTRMRIMLIPRIRISEERFIEEDKTPPLHVRASKLAPAIFFVLLYTTLKIFVAI